MNITLKHFLLLAALLAGAGCGERAAKLSPEQGRAFDGAPAEVKQAWDKALAADKAGDFVTAQTQLDSLKKMILSDTQHQALQVECDAFGGRLMQAVEKNNPAAIEAVKNSQKIRGR